MNAWRRNLRRSLELLGYTAHRWPANRFDGMQDALILLRRAGYAPRVVIDCGANLGQWTRMARSVFPEAAFHLIEPQPACGPVLRDLARRTPHLTFHPVAVTEPGHTRVRMIGGGDAGTGTGAWVGRTGESAAGESDCPATTLDALLADAIARADRALLKLDLEGHELSALAGGARTLNSTEVVLTEVQFYEIEANGRPVFADLHARLHDHGFELFDFACLSARPRDQRLRTGDVIFVRQNSPLLADGSWE